MNKVYILGAGASAGYDKSEVSLRSPTARDFFKKAMQLIDKNAIEGQRFHNLFNFLEKYYCFKKEDIKEKELDIEEVLTMLDLETSKNELKMARKELLEMIFLTLNKILYGKRCPYHKKLIENLKPTDTLITFNWDLLVDNVLSERDVPDYKGNFSAFYIDNQWRRSCGYSNGPGLIKLHGSLNWMACKKCNKNYCYVLSGKVAADQVINPEDPKTLCPGCQKQMEPIIIPPTLAKRYSNELLDSLWAEASNSIKEANKIIIIGYSLPVTDFKAKWLFMKSVAMRRRPLETLTIVDKYPDALGDKFKGLFKIKNDRFSCIEGEIKEYVECHIQND